LAILKPRWQALIEDQPGFYLEDKGWALAIHARHASEADADRLLSEARRILDRSNWPHCRILDGQRFLEICPQSANKGLTVKYLLERYPWPEALLVYAGDDDKDEEAFEVIQQHGGLTVKVTHANPQPGTTRADFLLASPAEVRRWLHRIPEICEV
jgi:trehalose-phosphatase